VEVLDIRL